MLRMTKEQFDDAVAVLQKSGIQATTKTRGAFVSLRS